VVADLRSFIEGELQVEPDMARHGYDSMMMMTSTLSMQMDGINMALMQ